MELSRIANQGTSAIKKYVPGKSIKEVQAELGLRDPIKLASNENAYGASRRSKRCLRLMAGHLHSYPDAESREIRARLAERLEVSPEQITVGNGADGVIYNLGMAVIDQGDEVIFPAITFPIYETVTRVMRGVPVYSAMQGMRIDLEDMRERIGDRTKLIFLCNPNNPTADALPPAELEAFLRSLPQNLLVVLDEAYVDFVEPEARFDSLALFRSGLSNLFVLRTFSKIYGLAGLRFGYAVGDRGLVALINQIKPPFDVSIVAEQAALEALSDRGFYDRTVAGCADEKRYFYRELQALGLAFPRSHTNFVLIDTGRDAGEMSQALLRRGVIVRSAAGYGLPTCIRVTVGRRRENERFFRELRRVLAEAK